MLSVNLFPHVYECVYNKQSYNYENQILQLSTDSRQASAILQTDI